MLAYTFRVVADDSSKSFSGGAEELNSSCVAVDDKLAGWWVVVRPEDFGFGAVDGDVGGVEGAVKDGERVLPVGADGGAVVDD